jgi:hypothetical protein
MDHQKLEEIGEMLRSLGHERREAVEAIVAAGPAVAGADDLYRALDRISEQAIGLMEVQREMIRAEIGPV